ncbi:MAG: STAS domain-containing protein, partial [Pseudomonadota bacterium]
MVSAASVADARAVLVADDRALRLCAEGRWTIDHAGEIDRLLRRLLASSQSAGRRRVEIDCGQLEHLDTAGAWLLRRAATQLADGRASPEYLDLQDRHALLLKTVDVPGPSNSAASSGRRSSIITDIGEATAQAAAFTYALIGFLGVVVVTVGRVAVTPRLWRPNAFVLDMMHER